MSGKGRQRHKRDSKRGIQSLFSADTSFVPTPADEAKMSAMLIELAAPYGHLDRMTLEQYQTLIRIAGLAWNAALIPEGEQMEMIRQIVKVTTPDLPVEAMSDFLRLTRQMMARKEALFAQERHIVTHTEVRRAGSGNYEVNVASTMDPAPRLPVHPLNETGD